MPQVFVWSRSIEAKVFQDLFYFFAKRFIFFGLIWFDLIFKLLYVYSLKSGIDICQLHRAVGADWKMLQNGGVGTVLSNFFDIHKIT